VRKEVATSKSLQGEPILYAGQNSTRNLRENRVGVYWRGEGTGGREDIATGGSE